MHILNLFIQWLLKLLQVAEVVAAAGVVVAVDSVVDEEEAVVAEGEAVAVVLKDGRRDNSMAATTLVVFKAITGHSMSVPKSSSPNIVLYNTLYIIDFIVFIILSYMSMFYTLFVLLNVVHNQI